MNQLEGFCGQGRVFRLQEAVVRKVLREVHFLTSAISLVLQPRLRLKVLSGNGPVITKHKCDNIPSCYKNVNMTSNMKRTYNEYFTRLKSQRNASCTIRAHAPGKLTSTITTLLDNAVS
jgi:hypothetical protein